MGDESAKLFRVAIDAYVERDDGKAAALDDMDDRLDALHKDYIQAIFETHERAELELQAGVQLALIGRYYERIGDHAVNIGERVRYMVTGWLPEHTGAAARGGPAPEARPPGAALGGLSAPPRHQRRRHRGPGPPRPRPAPWSTPATTSSWPLRSAT